MNGWLVYCYSHCPTFVAQEFASLIERMPPLTDLLPDLKRYLLGYPKMTLPYAESFLDRQNAKFGLKPTIRISHVTMARQPAGAVVVSKTLVRYPLFLDGDRAARSPTTSSLRRRILVRHEKP